MRSFILVCICLMLTSQALGNRHGVRSFLRDNAFNKVLVNSITQAYGMLPAGISHKNIGKLLRGKEVASKARDLFLAGAVAVMLVAPNAVQAEEGSATKKIDTTREQVERSHENEHLETEYTAEEASDASSDDDTLFRNALSVAGGWGYNYGTHKSKSHSLLFGLIYESLAESNGKLIDIELAAMGSIGNSSTRKMALDNSYLSAVSYAELPLATSDSYSGGDDSIVLFFDGRAIQYPKHGRQVHAIVGLGFFTKYRHYYYSDQELPFVRGDIGIGKVGYGWSKYNAKNLAVSRQREVSAGENKSKEESSYSDIEGSNAFMFAATIGEDPISLGYRVFGATEQNYNDLSFVHELTAAAHFTDDLTLRGFWNWNTVNGVYFQLMANIKLNSLFN